MNYGWIGRTINKNTIKNSEKSKNRREIAANEQKSLARQRIFVQT